MSVEIRAGRAYVYDKRREGSTVVSTYKHRATIADVLAAATTRAARKVGISLCRAPERVALGEDCLSATGPLVGVMTKGAMLALGFRMHKGQWRMSRTANGDAGAHGASNAPQQGSDIPLLPAWTPEQLRPVVLYPHQEPMDLLDELINSLPEERSFAPGLFEGMDDDAREMGRQVSDVLKHIELDAAGEALRRQARLLLLEHRTAWSEAGGITLRAALHLARTMHPRSVEDRAGMLVAMDRLRIDLGYLEAPAPVRLLIDQAVLAWAHLQIVLLVATMMSHDNTMAPQHGAYWDERLRAAERRHERSLEAVVRIGRLLGRSKRTRAEAAAVPDARDAQTAMTWPGTEDPDIPAPTHLLGAHAFCQSGMDLAVPGEPDPYDAFAGF